MRPKEVKRSSKKGKRGKAGAASSVRSKVTEVKKRARMRNDSGREEILDLVTTATPQKRKTLAKTVSGKFQKVKSAVGIGNRHSRLQDTPSAAAAKNKKDSPAKVKRLQKSGSSQQRMKNSSPSAPTPTRRSARRLEKSMNGGGEKMDVEKAKEAIELNGDAGHLAGTASGFLQKAVSKIWRRPSYEAVGGAENGGGGGGGGGAPNSACVIS